eukprot:TRINITY_DN2382_c0_g1_i4.p1 TRINITY_DN2382_c0_g1~~TRINITY_DN2382_c0_g1_i4.p1  ORF type:complete len:225 (+),score=66.67 TRINITY_DN2382_c0_g1_i4:88-762(+)
MIRRPPRSTLSSSSAASDVYKRQVSTQSTGAQRIAMATDESPLKSNLQQMYIFSDKEASVKKVFEHYDADHDGNLSPEEFSNMCYDLGVTMSDEECQAAVSLMDRDGDGNVVFAEAFEWWCSSSNIFRMDEKKFAIAQFAIGLFRYYDLDRKGYITKDQYAEGVAVLKESDHPEYAPWVEYTFEEFDCKDVDGWVTMNEFMSHVVEIYFPDHEQEQADRAQQFQ